MSGTSTTDLDNLLVSANIAMVLLDRRNCIRRFTPAATALFSFLPSDVGRPIHHLSPRFSDPTFLPDILLVLEGAAAARKEVKSTEGLWYVRQTFPYRLRDGSIDGAVITFSEVAGGALQEARLYAESIVDSVREPLVVLDGDLRVHSVNHPFSSLFRISSQEIVGQPLREIGGGVWNVPALLSLLERVLESGTSMGDFELTYESTDAGTRELLLSARTLHRGGGRPGLILLAVDDVTEKRCVAAILKEVEANGLLDERVRQRQLEITNAMRMSTAGELATGLAHELNQPLSSIVFSLEACARYVRASALDPAKLLELLEQATGESLRAVGIVTHLRSLVNKGESQLDPVDLVEVLRHVPHLLLGELGRIRVEFSSDFPNGTLPVLADQVQIEQVVVNLLQNAMDSIRGSENPERRIALSARKAKGMAVVRVLDSGAGLSPEVAERLFTPFFTTKTQGLGMGLALSRSILAAHGGRIWAETPPQRSSGAVLCFEIPLQGRKKGRRGVEVSP
ncbi:MAG: PAS domain-containing protein [Candidatus Binatia bacterium]